MNSQVGTPVAIRLGMDKPINKRRKSYLPRVAAVIGIITFVSAWAFYGRGPIAPAVEQDELRWATVQRGNLVVDVAGSGVLAPEEVRWLTTRGGGLMEERLAEPGDRVQPGLPIARLSDARLSRDATEARWQLDAARAEYAALEVQLGREEIDQQLRVAQAEADYASERLVLDAQAELAAKSIVSAITLRQTQLRVDQLASRVDLEKRRLDIWQTARTSQLQAKQAYVAQFEGRYADFQQRIEELTLRSPIHGVVEEIMFEPGQTVDAGRPIARIVDPDKLQAEVQISQHQANQVLKGQRARVRLGSEEVLARVSAIDPTVVDGTVRMTLLPETVWPARARPDLAVTARIVVSEMTDTLFVTRPVSARAGETVSLYRRRGVDGTADLVQVQLGELGAREAQIMAGLDAGDRIVISDTRRFDGSPVIRIN